MRVEMSARDVGAALQSGGTIPNSGVIVVREGMQNLVLIGEQFLENLETRLHRLELALGDDFRVGAELKAWEELSMTRPLPRYQQPVEDEADYGDSSPWVWGA